MQSSKQQSGWKSGKKKLYRMIDPLRVLLNSSNKNNITSSFRMTGYDQKFNDYIFTLILILTVIVWY